MPLPLVLTEEFHVDEGKTAVGAAFITSAWPDHPGRWTYIPDPMRDRLVEGERHVFAHGGREEGRRGSIRPRTWELFCTRGHSPRGRDECCPYTNRASYLKERIQYYDICLHINGAGAISRTLAPAGSRSLDLQLGRWQHLGQGRRGRFSRPAVTYPVGQRLRLRSGDRDRSLVYRTVYG